MCSCSRAIFPFPNFRPTYVAEPLGHQAPRQFIGSITYMYFCMSVHPETVPHSFKIHDFKLTKTALQSDLVQKCVSLFVHEVSFWIVTSCQLHRVILGQSTQLQNTLSVMLVTQHHWKWCNGWFCELMLTYIPFSFFFLQISILQMSFNLYGFFFLFLYIWSVIIGYDCSWWSDTRLPYIFV